MITLIKDNTNETFYTRCWKCESEFSYEFNDVEFRNEQSPFPTKFVKCPACGYKSLITFTSINGSLNLPYLNNCCCAGDDK